MSVEAVRPLVEVRNLERVFDVSKPWLNRVIERQPKAFLTAVSDISLDIRRGEHTTERVANDGFVINDQEFCHRAAPRAVRHSSALSTLPEAIAQTGSSRTPAG